MSRITAAVFVGIAALTIVSTVAEARDVDCGLINLARAGVSAVPGGAQFSN